MNSLREYVSANIASAREARGDWKHIKCPSCGDAGRHLGVNIRTGHIHCLRCGVSANLSDKIASTVYTIRKQSSYDAMYDYEQSAGDDAVLEYMRKRNLHFPDVCLAFGRGAAEGMLALLSFDDRGYVVYAQWRNFVPGSKNRYLSLKGSIPRLNHAEDGNGRLLVLTEGPIDSVRVRQATGLWTSPVYGSSINQDFMTDIVLADPSMVLLMFDNDEAGLKGSRKAYSTITSSGIECRVAQYEKDHPKDAGEMTDYQISTIMGRALTATACSTRCYFWSGYTPITRTPPSTQRNGEQHEHTDSEKGK